MARISELSIEQVWLALGGPPLNIKQNQRQVRAKAFYRSNADGQNISINLVKNIYFDFVTNEGGGVVDLVIAASGCTRSHAVKWLCERFGIAENKPLSWAEKRRLQHEKKDREQMEYWRNAYLAHLDSWLSVLHDALAAKLARDRDPEPEIQVPLKKLTWLESHLARATHRELLEAYRTARRMSPAGTAELVAAAREDDRNVQELTLAVVNILVLTQKEGR